MFQDPWNDKQEENVEQVCHLTMETTLHIAKVLPIREVAPNKR